MKSDGMKNLSIEELSKLIEVDGKNPDNYYRRAIAYKDKGMFDKAHGDIDQAISLNPNYAEYYFLKGLIFFRDSPKDWSWRDKKDEYGCMINSFNKAIELNPNVAKFYMYRGSVRNALLDPSEVSDNGILNDFIEAVKIDPKMKSSWIKLGDQYRIRGEYSKAVEAYTKAIEINPTFSSVLKRAVLYDVVLKDYEKAIKDYTILLTIKKNARLYYHRGKLFLKSDLFDEALTDFFDFKSLINKYDFSEKVNLRKGYKEYKEYIELEIFAFLSYIYLKKGEVAQHENNLNLFIKNVPFKQQDSDKMSDAIKAISKSCMIATTEQFYKICKIIFGISTIEEKYKGLVNIKNIVKYLDNPVRDLNLDRDFVELDTVQDQQHERDIIGLDSMIESKFPRYRFNRFNKILDFIIGNMIMDYGDNGHELYTLNIKSLILENFFGGSIIPSKVEPAGQLGLTGNEVQPDGTDITVYEYQKPKSANTSDVILKSKLYIGILVKLNERIFQITEEKRRSDEDEKKEELARQAEHHRREKERMIQQYSHTLANTLYPNAIYEVANRLKSHIEFRRDARILTDAYLAETIIRNQGLLLQARNTGSSAEFQQLIRGDRLSEDTQEKAIGIEEILNSSVERIVARFLNADYRKLELIRTEICTRRKTTLDKLKADFEENVFFNPNRTAIEWANANIGSINFTLSPLWNSIHLRRDGYAEALLQGYFQELLFNALKYRDSEQDVWINIRFYEEKIESRTFLVGEWENPYTQNASISTGQGLGGIQNDLEILNETHDKDRTLKWNEINGRFQATLRLLKDIFIPYQSKYLENPKEGGNQ